MVKMTVVIPAYNPDFRLIELVDELKASCDYNVIVVNDGSGKEFSSIFEEIEKRECVLLTHDSNKGKGAALKTAFAYIVQENLESTGVITADADGQHLVKDIIRVAIELEKKADTLVLGAREFAGKVPFRSRFGNSITTVVFFLASGKFIADTQTGLRGIPANKLGELCSLQGERYEYEINMLLNIKKLNLFLSEIPIVTIYLDKNKSSHFHIIRDSAKIYWKIIAFSFSSLASFAIDYSLFFILEAIFSSLAIAAVGARIVSSICNYLLNRNIVFTGGKTFNKILVETLGYFTLAAFILTANYYMISWLSQTIHIKLFLSKVITDVLLFSISYIVQHYIIFKQKIT